MHSKNTLSIGTKIIGPDEKALLIAEISANHDRCLEQALTLVDIAADAGWDCLKLQTYDADSLTVKSSHPSMKVDRKWGKENLYELYASACMPIEFHEPLFSKARDRGMIPFTSVYDPRDLDFISNLGCEILKISSFELTFDDLLSEAAQLGKMIILSTGMATIDEIEHALEIIEKNGSPNIMLLHCCSSYPAPLEEINLNAMMAMKERFRYEVGFSDHTIGSIGPLTAIAMGAVAVEKHFTNDPNRVGPDHRFSATPEILKEIAQGASAIKALKGSKNKSTTPAESESKRIGRRSAFAIRSLGAGDIITEADFRFVRPGVGIPANDKSSIIGKQLVRDIAEGHPIGYADLML